MRVTVQTLSYVGADGKSISVDAKGYVQDRRDSRADVLGFLDSTRGSQIGLAVVADALQAVGGLTTQKEFDTTRNTDGSASSSFTGSVTKATAGALLSGGAGRMGKMIAEDAATYVDVVIIQAGAPVYFKTLKRIAFTGVRLKEESLDEI